MVCAVTGRALAGLIVLLAAGCREPRVRHVEGPPDAGPAETRVVWSSLEAPAMPQARWVDANGRYTCAGVEHRHPGYTDAGCVQPGYESVFETWDVWTPDAGGVRYRLGNGTLYDFRDCANSREVPATLENLTRAAPDFARLPLLPANAGDMRNGRCADERLVIVSSPGVRHAVTSSAHAFGGNTTPGDVRLVVAGRELARWHLEPEDVPSPCTKDYVARVPRWLMLEVTCEGDAAVVVGAVHRGACADCLRSCFEPHVHLPCRPSRETGFEDVRRLSIDLREATARDIVFAGE